MYRTSEKTIRACLSWTTLVQSCVVKHGASLYLRFEGLDLSIVIIFKPFHWLKNFESCSVISVARHCCFANKKLFYVVVG